MKVNFKMIYFQVEVNSQWQMEEATMVIFIIIRNRVMEYTQSPMGPDMKGIG